MAIAVRRLPVDPGPAGWNALLPAPAPATPVDADMTADWAIIGAGFAGLAAARRLSQLRPQDRIVVLDAHRIGDGPAGRNSGFMIDLPHDLASKDYGGALDRDMATTVDNRHAIDFSAAMAEEFALPADAFRRCGKINAAATGKGARHNAAYAAHLQAMGEPFDIVDTDQMRALTGTRYYRDGLFTPGTAIIQPAMFVRGVADGLRALGVDIREMSPVTGLSRNGDWVLRTPKGRVTAPRVILAVNGHLNSFGFLTNRLMHVFTYASMTEPLGPEAVAALGGRPVWGATPADPMGTTVRRISGAGGDRIVVRNRFTFDPSMEVDAARIARVARDHDAAFRARFPMLAGTNMAYRWGGRLCLSRNNVSVVRELEESLFAACCQNGLGTVRGTLSGILAAELATNTHSSRLTRALAADLPTRVPQGPIARAGANALMRWQERRAGGEL